MEVRKVERARWAVTAVFLVNGCAVSSYISRIPSLKLAHQLPDGQLGVVLTLFGAAALVAMQFVGGLVSRFGSRRVIRLALVLLPVTLVGVGQARDGVQLGIAVVLMGVVHGSADVAMNAHAVAVERLRGRPLMSGCHAAWSIAAVLASLTAAFVTRASVAPGEHFLYAATPLLVAGAIVTRWLLPSSADQIARATGDKPRSGWTRPVLVLGAMGFVVMIGEAAVIGWSGVFMHDVRGAGLALAALGFTAFTAAQTLGRIVGDRLTERYGASSLFRVCGLISVVGLSIVLVVPVWPATLAGLAILGLGGSVLMPLIYSAVGREGGAAAAAAVSRLTTFTYAGILIGPAVVGWSAQLIGLTWTFGVLLPLLLGVAANGRLLSPKQVALTTGDQRLR